MRRSGPLATEFGAGPSAAEREYAALIETAGDGIVSADRDGVITGFNPAAERIFGYPPGEAVGESLTLLIPERFRDLHRRGLERFLATGEPHLIGSTVELAARQKDGTEIPVELTLSSWEVAGETHFTAFVRDVTKRHRMQHVSRELAAIVEQSEDAILRQTREGIVTEWNRGAERMYGYAAGEMIDNPIDVLVPEEHEGEERRILGSVLAGEVIPEYETVRLRKDGGRIDLAMRISPLRDAGGEIIGASAIARDISERKRAERELRRSNEDLERFAHVASHDLSEPLRVIAGFVDLLARRYEGRLDEEADRFIRFTVSGVERMQALIDAILAYSQVGRAELHRTEIDTAELVAGVLRDLKGPIAERGTQVEVGDLPRVWAEPALLAQVFQNLIGNAIKFADGTDPRVRVLAARRRDGWRFHVEDNGPGVPARQAERIFEMFQRLHGRDTPGTGVGLAIAKRIVERHDGQIRVDPAPGAGSIFSFTVAEPQRRAT